jgi:hypothetical protein
VAASKIASGKASACAGSFPQVASKEAGVPVSQDAKRKLWAIHPFAPGMEAGTGEGLAQETLCLNGDRVSVLFLLHYERQ